MLLHVHCIGVLNPSFPILVASFYFLFLPNHLLILWKHFLQCGKHLNVKKIHVLIFVCPVVMRNVSLAYESRHILALFSCWYWALNQSFTAVHYSTLYSLLFYIMVRHLDQSKLQKKECIWTQRFTVSEAVTVEQSRGSREARYLEQKLIARGL